MLYVPGSTAARTVCVGISDRAHYNIQAVYLMESLERSVMAHSSGSVFRNQNFKLARFYISTSNRTSL
jgi:hypothetical protein